jgi:ABC-type nitrate/sulfonate/bicarbonate transport system ATPase subunit
VTLDVAAGELVALIGPTGCGKSTVLRVLAGLLVPTAGSATIDGASTIGRPGAAAFMPQRDSLLPWRSAVANATLGAEIAGERGAAEVRARELFVRFGLHGFEGSRPAALSGGMRQRVALLRTVLTGRAVLLLDEPFGSLDAITRRDLHSWLAELLAAETRTTLLVTHDIDEALALADRVVVLSSRPGRIVDVVSLPARRPGVVRDVTDSPSTDAKRRLLNSLLPR